MRAGLLSRSVGILLVLSTMTLSGCIEEKTATTLDDKGAAPAVGNETKTLVIPKGTGAIGHRVCVQGAMGGPTCPVGSGMTAAATGASNNPYSWTVEGVVKSAKVTIKFTGSGPATSTTYEAIITQRGACTGGAGAGGQSTVAEIGRKTGASPIVFDLPTVDWKVANKCMRVQLNLPSRAPSPAYVGASSGDSFTVEGEYVAETAPAAMKAAATMGTRPPGNGTQPA